MTKIEKIELENGTIYEGEVNENGVPHGNGTETTLKGFVYECEFKEGSIVQGIVTFPDGKKIEGKFKEGIPHGKITIIFPNGKKYVGESKKTKPHGCGTFVDSNGTKLEGEFKDGLPHGHITATLPNGEKQEGMYYEGKLMDVDESKKN